jgi:hypothetical protein
MLGVFTFRFVLVDYSAVPPFGRQTPADEGWGARKTILQLALLRHTACGVCGAGGVGAAAGIGVGSGASGITIQATR